MNAKEVVETWVERFNACDAAALSELYHVTRSIIR